MGQFGLFPCNRWSTREHLQCDSCLHRVGCGLFSGGLRGHRCGHADCHHPEKQSTTSNDERSNSPGHVNAGLEATGHLDEVLRHEEGKAGGEGVSHVDDMGGDPIYDRADSMTSAIALQDIAMSN
ncbi:hypothetical protein CAPTEDRAFT_199136 [Capitella teleta]|uniref:Uncharacterized protein n=1 Tax=Capitella teleta TaxID=283909 RepID=R7UIU4_CAPTE|nr:hypothetical protein CAPTEDRAFT_199136 [Capitella teleta]|eukprot:ELU06013.1 hypothetical protein CAPTEDRAFT_199136 [Capitella teleta]